MSSQNRIGIVLAIVVAMSAMAVVLTQGSETSTAAATAGLNVQCAPAQRAVIHQAGQTGVTVECVDLQPTSAATIGSTVAAPAPRVAAPPVPAMGYATQAYPTAAPAPVYTQTPVAMIPAAAAPAVYHPATTVATEAPRTRQAPAPAPSARVDSGPSTRERLLIIGGSAGAGAGIGALMGGKKGAGIGALIGGGGAAIVDQIKN